MRLRLVSCLFTTGMEAYLIRILLHTGIFACLQRCQRESECHMIGYRSGDLTCHLLNNQTGSYRIDLKVYDSVKVSLWNNNIPSMKAFINFLNFLILIFNLYAAYLMYLILMHFKNRWSNKLNFKNSRLLYLIILIFNIWFAFYLIFIPVQERHGQESMQSWI